MNVCNYTNKVSTKQIHKLVSLLPKEYTNNDIPVFVFGSKVTNTLMNWITTHNFEDYNTCAGYMTYEGYKPTRIVMHNKGNRLTFAFNLFHEFRHVYQATHMMDMFKKSANKYVNCGIGNDKLYDSQMIEIDANRFAYNMIKMHRKQICNILNIYYEYPKFPESKIYVNKYREL